MSSKARWTYPKRMARIAALVVGAVAQLGERRVRNAKVEGSIPFRSTTCSLPDQRRWLDFIFSPEAAIGAGAKYDLPAKELPQNHMRFQCSAWIPIQAQLDLLPVEG